MNYDRQATEDTVTIWNTTDLSCYELQNTWMYFVLLRRCVANDNGCPLAEERWLRAHRRARA